MLKSLNRKEEKQKGTARTTQLPARDTVPQTINTHVLLTLIAPHLGNPLVHMGELILESLLQLLPRHIHGVPLSPVREAVFEYLAHVCQEVLFGSIFAAVHLGLHGGEIHGDLDFV